METLSEEHPLSALARVLDVARSTHYCEPGRSTRAVEDAWLTEKIATVFENHKRRYGSPRIHTDLRAQGIRCGEKRVARLMRKAGLRAKTPKRKTPRTTESRHGGPIAPNLLKDMKIDRPNQAWAMDITYIPQGNTWAYLAAVLDLYLHKIVGWDLSETLHAEVACNALRSAQKRQGYPDGVVIHSDRGCQYASEAFVGLSGHFGCIRSMSAKGNCYDNATMESFFGVLKREELNDFDFDSMALVRVQVFEYIETYYNRTRIHSTLGMSPEAFEAQHDAAPETWGSPQVGGETVDYPLEGCSPAESSSVSPDTMSIQNEPLAIKH